METLQTWWATELYPSKDEDTFGVAGDFEVVRAADAQATIAALQARVQELEAIKIPDDAFTYCAYCGEKSPVDEHNEDLSAHIKVCPKHPMRDVESQLTQRTAELEAAKQHLREGEEAYHKVGELNNHLKAELERVRGELVEATHNANVYQSLYSTGCMDRALLENELRDAKAALTATSQEGQG